MSEPYAFRSMESVAETAQISSTFPTGGSFRNSDYRIKFDCYVQNPAARSDTVSLLDLPEQQSIRDQYLWNVAAPGFLSAGVLSFSDYSFFENCALPIEVRRREAIIGEPVCWGIDFAKWYAGQHNLDTLMGDNLSRRILNPTLRDLRHHRIRNSAVIMSAPGQEIYGHWLLDIIPRLHVLSLGPSFHLPIYFNNLPRWATYFLDALDIDLKRFLPHPSRFFRVENALVPTASKSGYRLGETSLKAAWARIADAYRPPAMARERLGQKVFFSRRKLTHSARRSPENIEDMELALERRGYKIVVPETLSIAEQICVMREARVVIGEDGSALHNIIFGYPGLRLGVLSLPERTNLWHMSLCQILGHSLAYCSLPEAGMPMDIAALNEFVDGLEG